MRTIDFQYLKDEVKFDSIQWNHKIKAYEYLVSQSIYNSAGAS